jgi:Asp-tRNA(Asn)/Glu-tRNA(Gln) amidotransferase A subunit family amidase
MVMDRRTFLATGLAATGAAVGASAQASNLETFTQWVNASRRARELELGPRVDRIRALDSSIHAWVQVLPQKPTGDGPLAEIPFGAKDIMETRGLSTEYGSPIYKGRIGTEDAAIVRELRQRGAILLGKTHTTSFAYRTPGPTRNPRNLEHTPGGSSSGSAAAVAAGMVPFALGTQTRGSVLRPASYCGVTGFKMSYGLMSMEGVLPFAKSLDTLGFFTHTPADMLALWESLGRASGAAEVVALGVPDPMPAVEPPMATAFQQTISRLRRAGASIRSIDIAGMLRRLSEASNTVMFYEGARFHRERFNEHGDKLADMADLVRKGLQIPVERYDEARRFIGDCKIRLTEMYKATPVILVPAATGPAPRGLASTGDPEMNAPWTAVGTPAISIPMPVESGLPLGLQITADQGQDARAIRTAVQLHGMLGSRA